ncbi:endonuclease 4-like isoform X2 [Glycine soja]|uniref:endonuclease 4-like isoform X2 n=1 Tax=Glycine soja TaxID=3848 RepID=UPI00103DE85A|nr:endonuclease 4-like isoform X2 [Glycine soja]
MHMIIGYERVRVLFLLFLIPLPTVLGWGKEGHYATCKIAQEYLSEDALFAVKQLLPDSAQGDLAAVCSWADEVGHTHRYHWSSALHYVDTPDFKCNYEYCNNLTEALMFLSHFVGDIHQPLHVGFTGDLGGNTITVHWYRRKANLHYVWDDLIIQSALKTFYDSDLSIMIQAIQRNITDNWLNDVSTWEHCAHNYTACPNRYASESISLACKFAYRNATPGSTLKDEYFLSRLPVVEKRLAQGGVRLAAILNRIFTSSKTRIAQA